MQQLHKALSHNELLKYKREQSTELGFNPHRPGSRAYSCWPVIVTPYNLPHWLCMNDPYMFLSLFIPRRSSPGKNIDVYLRPLTDGLKLVWTDGVNTWVAIKK